VLDTAPPSPADNVTIYLTIGAGIGFSSDEQDINKVNVLRKKSSFFIK